MEGQSCRVLISGGVGEIVEKKSRFIATVRPAGSEEEANAFIEEMKKKYWDARHNCSAYVIGRRGELARCSDDGEPGGTAGRPMLEVLLGEGIRNIAVVVTRYFGGILLGKGGLARAYARAVKEGLSHCETGSERLGHEIGIEVFYPDLGKVQSLLGQEGIVPTGCEYTDKAVLTLPVPADSSDRLKKELEEATEGRIKWSKIREYYFVDKDTLQR